MVYCNNFVCTWCCFILIVYQLGGEIDCYWHLARIFDTSQNFFELGQPKAIDRESAFWRLSISTYLHCLSIASYK